MRIADVMQVPMKYDRGHIQGFNTIHYIPFKGLDIPVTATAKKVSVFEQTAVLFHFGGHLWALVGHYARTNALTMFLIDGKKVEVDGVMITPDKVMSKMNTLKETVDAVREAIVKSFLWRDTHWEEFVLPK